MTVFVYSAGKLIAEYSTAQPEPNPTTKWTVTDQLGSPRILVNSLGEVVSRRDFLPFGEEITPDGTHRTTNLKYNFGDNVRQKFTGYQKDEETQLDFAEARMYQNLHARFTAVDPLLASGKSGNPQTFNRYVYVLNSPLIFTDPTGLQVASWTGPVYTNGRTISPEPLIGEKNEIVTGSYSRYVDATDGYSYAFNESGSTLLGRTADLNALAERLMPDRTQMLVNSIGRPLNEAIDGITTGAGNFGKGAINSVTDSFTGGSLRDRLGFENPFALERTPYETPRSAAYGYFTEGAFMAWSAAATGGAAGAGTASTSTSLRVTPSGFTRSYPGLGQRMHAEFMLDKRIPNLAIKEYRLPSGKRIDFLDIPNATIYELKPFNPAGFAAGRKQLQVYKTELKTIPEFQGIQWKTRLRTY